VFWTVSFLPRSRRFNRPLTPVKPPLLARQPPSHFHYPVCVGALAAGRLFLGPVALQWLHGFGKWKVVCGACDFGYPTKFILLELSSPSRRIFIGSDSLPPLSSRLFGPSACHVVVVQPSILAMQEAEIYDAHNIGLRAKATWRPY
jgi:hypothetical protein